MLIPLEVLRNPKPKPLNASMVRSHRKCPPPSFGYFTHVIRVKPMNLRRMEDLCYSSLFGYKLIEHKTQSSSTHTHTSNHRYTRMDQFHFVSMCVSVRAFHFPLYLFQQGDFDLSTSLMGVRHMYAYANERKRENVYTSDNINAVDTIIIFTPFVTINITIISISAAYRRRKK